MARIRILLPTYRRAHLLPRALAGLQSQTFTDWICHVHNDDPADPAPARIVAALGDPRISCTTHQTNLGLTEMFNLLFAPGNEPYGALLEDDNWWEPPLLERLHTLLEARPEAGLAWANMHCWREETDGGWTRLGSTIWPVPPAPGIREFHWPSPVQVLGHVHSNGAALCRLHRRTAHVLPSSVIPGCTEAIRERSFPSPLLLVEEPLAHFAITRHTARPGRLTWSFVQQILLAASFFRHATPQKNFLNEVWDLARHGSATRVHILILGAWLARRPDCTASAGLREWLWFLAWMLRRPVDCWRGINARRLAPELWAYLDHQTALRCRIPPHPL